VSFVLIRRQSLCDTVKNYKLNHPAFAMHDVYPVSPLQKLRDVEHLKKSPANRRFWCSGFGPNVRGRRTDKRPSWSWEIEKPRQWRLAQIDVSIYEDLAASTHYVLRALRTHEGESQRKICCR